MADVELPRAGDVRVGRPPVRYVWARRVPGMNLWVLYDARPDSVVAVAVLTAPPVPAEP